jgi:hypothetical protein
MLPMQDERFYEMYLYNYFRIRAIALHQFLANMESYNSMFSYVSDITSEHLLSSLKLEIRGTYFQAIETLFELLLALESDGQDLNIWKNLTKGKFHYNEIEGIANRKNSLLDKHVKWNEGEKIFEMSFVQYAFYFRGVVIEKEEVEKNLQFITKFLTLIAKEFSDRIDYNAYKHGLRLFPTIAGLSFHGQEAALGFDLSNSYTMLDQNDEYSHIIKSYDPFRDLRMISTCGELISNLVAVRRGVYVKANNVSIFQFHKDNFEEFVHSNVKVGDVRISIRPIEPPQHSGF